MLSLALFITLGFSSGQDSLLPPDGPYLLYEDEALVAHWVDTEHRHVGSAPLTPEHHGELPAFPTFRPELVDPARTFVYEHELTYDGVDRVAAISDIHGQFHTGRKLLFSNEIIDEHDNWAFGDGHLVIVGDIFDRGDQVTEMLWLVHNLQIQAEATGGKVHFLLGNHETMIMEGDDRYLHDRYRITSGQLGKTMAELYGPDTYLGRWLRSLPLAVTINGTLFIHGGLSRPVARQMGSLERLNELYHEKLMDTDALRANMATSPHLELLHGRKGPLWFRGYFSRRNFDENDLEYVLRKANAERIVVGHTSFSAVSGHYDNRVIAVDSSIKFGSVGELLLIEGGELYRATILGEKFPLVDTSK